MPATLGCVIATPTELPLQMGGPSPALPWGELERGFGVLSPVPLHKARGHPPLSSYLVWTAGEAPSVFIVLDYGHPV